MPSLFRAAVEVAMEWSIPTALAGVGGWVALKHRAVRDRWRKRQARRVAIDTFIESHMPVLARFVEGAKEREDRANARETRVAMEIQGFREHLNRQDGMLYDIAAQLWAAARFDVQARFQCDSHGRNIAVNAAYAALLRVSEFALGDLRWKNHIDDADAQRYLSLVDQHFREHRRFEGDVVFRRGDGTRFRARVRIEPHPEDAADLAEGHSATWFGSVMLVEELP